MKTQSLLLFVFTAIACFQLSAQYDHQNLKIKSIVTDQSNPVDPVGSSPAQFDLSYTYENLRLFPIVANDAFVDYHKDLGQFTLLKSAIEENKIIISETGTRGIDQNASNVGNVDVSGTVNTLLAKNVSTDTIFIMAGEVVKGGKQDRVIGQDLVLAPGQEMDISAFCVEHNRWTTKEGNGGKFNNYFSVSSMDIRKIVTEEKDQSGVWNKVDEHTTANGASSTTKTYTNLANSAEYKEKTDRYLEKLKDVFKDDKHIIGFIAVTGDQVIGCDLFATNQLFSESYESLLYSYMGYAITNGAPVTISNEQVYAYLDEILKVQENQDAEIEKNGTVYEYNKKKLHLTKY